MEEERLNLITLITNKMASKIYRDRTKDNFSLYFFNPIEKTKEYIKTSKDKSILENIARERDIEFYSNHKYLIPSGITIDTKKKRFMVYNRYHKYKSQKTLEDALQQKEEIIRDLTTPKYIQDKRKNEI